MKEMGVDPNAATLGGVLEEVHGRRTSSKLPGTSAAVEAHRWSQGGYRAFVGLRTMD